MKLAGADTTHQARSFMAAGFFALAIAKNEMEHTFEFLLDDTLPDVCRGNSPSPRRIQTERCKNSRKTAGILNWFILNHLKTTEIQIRKCLWSLGKRREKTARNFCDLESPRQKRKKHEFCKKIC